VFSEVTIIIRMHFFRITCEPVNTLRSRHHLPIMLVTHMHFRRLPPIGPCQHDVALEVLVDFLGDAQLKSVFVSTLARLDHSVLEQVVFKDVGVGESVGSSRELDVRKKLDFLCADLRR